MSFKDSMVRGLALYGASMMAQYTPGNAKVMADTISDNKIAR